MMALICPAILASITCRRRLDIDQSYISGYGAFDLQGLNIAPALITVAPVKTVVNPVGPLSVSDTLISVTVPAAGGK